MSNFQFVWLSVVFCGGGILLIPFLPSSLKSVTAFLLVLANAVATSIPAIHTLTGNPTEIHLYGISFFSDVPLRIDALSAWFMLIINFTCINGALYGIGYMKSYEEQKGNTSLHWVLYLLFQTSMLWVCMLQHSLAFLVAWEIMSVSSLLLVMFEHNSPDTLKAGVNYLVQMHIAVVFLSVAFIWVYFSEGSFDFNSPSLQTVTIIGRVSLLMLGLILLIYFIRKSVSSRKPSAFLPTWGCGYAEPSARMQYTGKSFSKTLAKLFNFITAEKKKYHELEPTVVFPEPRKYSSHYIDFFEARLINKANNRIIGFLNYFTFIHNGKIQMYVLYGCFFIVSLILATFFNLL